jgi:hypothetical protein
MEDVFMLFFEIFFFNSESYSRHCTFVYCTCKAVYDVLKYRYLYVNMCEYVSYVPHHTTFWETENGSMVFPQHGVMVAPPPPDGEWCQAYQAVKSPTTPL